MSDLRSDAAASRAAAADYLGNCASADVLSALGESLLAEQDDVAKVAEAWAIWKIDLAVDIQETWDAVVKRAGNDQIRFLRDLQYIAHPKAREILRGVAAQADPALRTAAAESLAVLACE